MKRLLLGAKSVSYPDPAGGAAAGVSFDETLRKLGIADQMQPTLKRAQGGANAMKMVATGEVQIGVTFVSEMNEPGIDIVGALPLEISTPTTLTGFVSSHAKIRPQRGSCWNIFPHPLPPLLTRLNTCSPRHKERGEHVTLS